jgi:hypothetical protein
MPLVLYMPNYYCTVHMYRRTPFTLFLWKRHKHNNISWTVSLFCAICWHWCMFTESVLHPEPVVINDKTETWEGAEPHANSTCCTSQTISADSLFCSSSRRHSLYSGLKHQHLLILPGSESSCSTEHGLYSVLMYPPTTVLWTERGDYSLLNKYRGFGIFSMKQIRSRQNIVCN